MQESGKKKWSAGLAAVLISSCVTTHVGKETKEDDFVLSCVPYARYSTEKIHTLSCVFENKSKDWTTFDVKSFNLPNRGATLSQARTLAFEEAIVARNRKSDHNVGVALLGLAAVGVVAMAAGGDSAGTAGAGAVLGASAASSAKSLSDATGHAQHGVPQYGKKHMLSGEFSVPPDLHVTRYVVVEMDKPLLANGMLPLAELCLEKPVNRCVRINPNFKYKSRAQPDL